MYNLVAQATLVQKVKEAHVDDQKDKIVHVNLAEGQSLPGWSVDSEGMLPLVEKLPVPKACRDEVLKEFHYSRFAVHPDGNKMYKDL